MGEHISLGICVSQVGEHISLGICVSQVGEHISLGICVSPVNMFFFFQLKKAKEEAEEAFTNISEVSKKEVRSLIEV